MLIAIIQARLTSKRFPNKILEKIGEKTMLQHVIDMANISKVDKVVVATPDQDIPFEFAEHFIGSEHDVLDRFYQCAKKYQADVIVRLTADSPLITPWHIDTGIGFLEDLPYIRFALIDGLDVEVFDFDMLEGAWELATHPYDREHVSPYMERITKLSVDTPEDLKRVRNVYARVDTRFKNYLGW